MIKETISEHKPIFILMIITITLLLIFTVIYFVMPVNAEEKEYAIEEIQTQTVKESENKNDNNTLNIDSNNATSQESEAPTEAQENILAEIRDTLYIISITLIIFTGAFLGYVAVSRLM